MAETLLKLERGEISARAQDGSQASLAPRLTKELGLIDWSRSAREIYNGIRGLAPWPGAYTRFRGQLCHVWGRPDEAQAAQDQSPGSLTVGAGGVYVTCGNSSRLRIEDVQLEGRKRVRALEFVNGARLATGERFGD